MIPGYPYDSMLVTGGLHFVLGVASCTTAICGLAVTRRSLVYFGMALLTGFWICLVAIIGLLASVKQFADDSTRKLKIGYMVTAVFSAVVFSVLAWWMYVFPMIEDSLPWEYRAIPWVGMIIAIMEFILAIVSASICCCCSPRNQNNTVIVQVQPPMFGTTIPGQTTTQYQSPPSNAIQYQLPQNTVMQYQTSGDGAVSEQPPAYQEHIYPIKPQ